jgi:hypothetical protein
LSVCEQQQLSFSQKIFADETAQLMRTGEGDIAASFVVNNA